MTERSSTHLGYQTEKLTFAAYLIATDRAELLGAQPIAKGRAVAFLLSKSPTPDDVTSFFNGSGVVSALRFAEAINNLKSVAYEVQRCH
ncbi:MAG: hypothetical protein NTW07_07390 [candidate division Zixibacteria bacterium]|nr:hypothetical protein [candidate division Zixibacteria bacterium]